MDFDLGEEYQLFRDTVRRWVDDQCPKAWCRALERQEHEYPQELWDRLTAVDRADAHPADHGQPVGV